MRRRLALLALCALACGERQGAREPPELETVDVGGGIDAGLSLADDVRARPPGEAVAGVVPSDFPHDFPVYSPATVVDFGPGWVELTSPRPPAAVEPELDAAARAAGWRAEGGGRYAKGGRTVTVELEPAASMTRLRLRY